jgi:hypothetical protein
MCVRGFVLCRQHYVMWYANRWCVCSMTSHRHLRRICRAALEILGSVPLLFNLLFFMSLDVASDSVASEREGSSQCSQEYVTGPYPEPTDSTLPQPISLRSILIPSWNNPFLHWESYNTHKYKKQSCLFIVKEAGTYSYHSVLNGKPLDHDVRYNCRCQSYLRRMTCFTNLRSSVPSKPPYIDGTEQRRTNGKRITN